MLPWPSFAHNNSEMVKAKTFLFSTWIDVFCCQPASQMDQHFLVMTVEVWPLFFKICWIVYQIEFHGYLRELYVGGKQQWFLKILNFKKSSCTWLFLIFEERTLLLQLWALLSSNVITLPQSYCSENLLVLVPTSWSALWLYRNATLE